MTRISWAIAAVMAYVPISAAAAPYVDPSAPFAMGEAMPDTPATCETIADWIDRPPSYSGRISMAIQGVLQESHWDGALAYLIMCPPGGVQVMCITYEPEEADPERNLLLAGGYIRVGEGQVVLDPCLTSPVPVH